MIHSFECAQDDCAVCTHGEPHPTPSPQSAGQLHAVEGGQLFGQLPEPGRPRRAPQVRRPGVRQNGAPAALGGVSGGHHLEVGEGGGKPDRMATGCYVRRDRRSRLLREGGNGSLARDAVGIELLRCIRHELGPFHWRTQHTDIQGMPCTFGFGAPIQSAECGGMTAFDTNVNQYAAKTRPRNIPVPLCVQKSALSASCQFVAPSSQQ